MNSVLAIGLMSGTSLDGVDAALIESDGADHARAIAFVSQAYRDGERMLLRAALEAALAMPQPGAHAAIATAEQLITGRHADAVELLLARAGVAAGEVAVIGFHGQTIAHRPERGWTWQIGDAQQLADGCGIPVVADFRSADVAAGGQGAPLLPVYHRALVAGLRDAPVAVLNLGGVDNISWFGAVEDAVVAFDTGPGNALIDDWMHAEAGLPFDADGRAAAGGRVHEDVLDTMLDLPWFDVPPPKSLDRHAFSLSPVRGLSTADGAATLAAFTAETVALALRHLPAPPATIFVAGGGRRNPVLTAMLAERTGVPIRSIDELGIDGDAVEAEGFAYMAIRSLGGAPISFPGTTGVAAPLSGGTLFTPAEVKRRATGGG
jgi:anhydro-N-acetylmuramic acid kinase